MTGRLCQSYSGQDIGPEHIARWSMPSPMQYTVRGVIISCTAPTCADLVRLTFCRTSRLPAHCAAAAPPWKTG